MRSKNHINAQLLYVITMAWFVAAIGCYIRDVGVLTLVFAALGLIHLVWAIVADIKEGKEERRKDKNAKKIGKYGKIN